MMVRAHSGATVCTTDSWEQPPLGLLLAVGSGNQVHWQPLSGVQYCSSSARLVYHAQLENADLEAWDALSDEAFINFETQL